MPALVLRHVSFAHHDSVPLFADLELHLTPGWTGVVGANGAGKTTLLRLIAGELRPDGGHVRREPNGVSVVLCPQLADELTAEVRLFAASGEAAARRWRGELAPGGLDRWASLSPGERKRWQIGAALAAEPEVLLLDEPTNHLDEPARRLLLRALSSFRGVGLVVSHDRDVLDGLTTATLRLERGAARLWPGSYALARAAWTLEEAALRDERDRLRARERGAARRLADAHREHAAAQASLSSKSRMKSRLDHDARGALAKGRAEAAERRIGRAVGVVRRKAERAAEATATVFVEDEVGRSIFVGYEPAPRPRLLALEADSVRAGEREVLRRVDVTVARDDRIRIEGRNGAGKTTLVRAMLAAASLPSGRILYTPQEIAEEEAVALLAEVRGLAPATRGRVLSAVAALGVDPDRLLASRCPSPGEARKLSIALGLGRHVWLLVLDEPSNHLDLPSVERLEAALDRFPGALVLVTHDPAFGRRCARTVWRIEDGTVRASTPSVAARGSTQRG